MYKINCVQEAASYKPVWPCTRQLMVLFLSGVGGGGGYRGGWTISEKARDAHDKI